MKLFAVDFGVVVKFVVQHVVAYPQEIEVVRYEL